MTICNNPAGILSIFWDFLLQFIPTRSNTLFCNSNWLFLKTISVERTIIGVKFCFHIEGQFVKVNRPTAVFIINYGKKIIFIYSGNRHASHLRKHPVHHHAARDICIIIKKRRLIHIPCLDTVISVYKCNDLRRFYDVKNFPSSVKRIAYFYLTVNLFQV